MRSKIFILLFLMCGLASHPAAAQSVVAAHQAAAPAPAPAPVPATAAPAPAKPSTIIPGSPLAALTGAPSAATPTATDADTASPFGTGNLGLSLTSIIGEETAHTIDTFVNAVEQSTQLTPVTKWLPTVAEMPSRRAHAMDILKGLAITVLPALVVEAIIRLCLTRPRAALAQRATARLSSGPNPAPSDEIDEGLADAEAGETEKRQRRKSVAAWGRRLVRALLYLLLSLLPIVGFAATTGILLGVGLITTRHTRLAIIGVSNAYLACRLILEILRFFFAPLVPALRLVAVANFRAGWLLLWARIILFTGAAAFVLVSIAELLGLSHDGRIVLIRLIALAVHVEVAVMIWQSRKAVARWIAGDPHATGALAGLRRRLAAIWHYLALFYVLALWIALAGGVKDAFSVLLRVVLVVVVALVLGRLAWSGSAHLLDRLFPATQTTTARYTAFYTRARVYNPLIRVVLRLIIALAVLITILQGWGIGALHWLLNDPVSRSLISAFIAIVITIAVALLVWEAINAFINSRIDGMAAAGHTRRASRLRTFLPMLRTAIGVVICIVAGLICLSKIGVNAAPLLAGAGVLGIAVAFGSQKLVQDIITGLFLLLEDAMQVGDVVNLAGMTGTVEKLSIRTIRLRGGDGSMNIIPFSAVTTVTNMTRDFGYAQITVQVGYEEDLSRVYTILDDISHAMRAEKTWGEMMREDLQIFGLDQFGASALVIIGQIRTGPGQHWAVRREFNARVKQRFEQEHIDMPYTYLAPAPPRPTEPPEQARQAALAAPDPGPATTATTTPTEKPAEKPATSSE